jgi:hypothetical protein
MSTEPIPQPALVTLVEDGAARRTIRATDPVNVLNLVPYLLGFQPEESLVVIGVEPPHATVGVTLRTPLLDSADPGLIIRHMDQVVDVLNRNEFPQALAIGYGSNELVTSFMGDFHSVAESCGIELLGLLRVEGSRYWSYTCTDPTCCPPEGIPFELTDDPELMSVLAGGVPCVLANRGSLAAQVSSVTGAEAVAMRRATRRAEARAARLREQASASDDEPSGHALLVREGIKAMTAAIQQYHDGGTIPRDQVAWLTVILRDIQIRDDAWVRLEAAHRKENLRLLLHLTQLARRGYVAPPATLMAFVAWQCGNGALANVALDRALGDDRHYSLAQTIRLAVNLGIPPRLARVTLTPEQVAEEYAKRAVVGRHARVR